MRQPQVLQAGVHTSLGAAAPLHRSACPSTFLKKIRGGPPPSVLLLTDVAGGNRAGFERARGVLGPARLALRIPKAGKMLGSQCSLTLTEIPLFHRAPSK